MIRKNKSFNIFFLFFVSIVVFYSFIRWNPLPSDDEMIDHLIMNKNEFDEVVSSFRNYGSDEGINNIANWYVDDDVRELLKNASVSHVSRLAPVWIDDPYSIESAKKIREISSSGKGYSFFRKNGTIFISLYPAETHRKNTILYGTIWKGFIHFPQAPRVEGGLLLWPVGLDGEYKKKVRVFDSLDFIPLDWDDFECIYKRIDFQWYLTLCNGN